MKMPIAARVEMSLRKRPAKQIVTRSSIRDRVLADVSTSGWAFLRVVVTYIAFDLVRSPNSCLDDSPSMINRCYCMTWFVVCNCLETNFS
jgi:hypothetical protein